MKSKILLLVLSGFILSCSTTKTLKFTPKKDEVFSNENLTSFLNENKNPKVVLRVTTTSNNLTDKEDNSYIYNAIENELLSSGFIVRDRQLFNQIVENDKNNADYSSLMRKSDTDLIIELTKIDSKILFETNKYYDKKNNEKVEPLGSYKRYGASVEFKVILIENNEFAGRYKFNYTPCTEGCVISLSPKDLSKINKMMKKSDVTPFEGVGKDVLEDFIKNATQRLVSEMRK